MNGWFETRGAAALDARQTVATPGGTMTDNEVLEEAAMDGFELEPCCLERRQTGAGPAHRLQRSRVFG
jgi:hypothetical protein